MGLVFVIKYLWDSNGAERKKFLYVLHRFLISEMGNGIVLSKKNLLRRVL